jgi:DNA-directed RNA polymerase specialized sigma24 family protein
MTHQFSAQEAAPKKDRTPTPRAFHQFLNWLDGGVDSDGRKYLEMRRRLVAYFDRKNNTAPDELADETLNRVARRLEEEGLIESEAPAKYCYIVARFVFMEHLRAVQKERVLRDDILRRPHPRDSSASEAGDRKERMLNCLEQCTGKLEQSSRAIILRYYSGKERIKIENRRTLAQSLGITVNALSIRACRIRDKLEGCVRECAGAE